MADIQLFDFEGNDVRTATHEDGSLWFHLSDLCSVLGLSNPSDVSNQIKEMHKSRLNLGSGSDHLFIAEPAMYRLVLRSRKPMADPFQTWITEKVIPQIRKTGAYAIPQSALRPMEQAHAIVSDHVALAALFDVPKHMALTMGVQQAERELGVDLSPYLLASPHMEQVEAEDVFLEPAELAERFGVGRNEINPLLASLGLQQKVGKSWEPSDDCLLAGVVTRHAWATKWKSGLNLKWRLSFIEQRLGR